MVDIIAAVISIIVSSAITSVFAYLVLKLLKDDRSFLKVLIVVIISNAVTTFIPYISTLGVPLPPFTDLIISIVISLFIFKFGLDLTWWHAVIFMILVPVIAALVGMLLFFIGFGTLLSLTALT